MESFDQPTKKSRNKRLTFTNLRRRKLHICLFVLTLIVILMAGVMCYLIYKTGQLKALKDSLRGTRYESREELCQTITGLLANMARDGLVCVYFKSGSRLRKSVESGVTSEEDTASAERLGDNTGGLNTPGALSNTGDLDGTDILQQMSETQKFFLNIGIRQDNLIQDCVESQFKLSFPNIDYAFFGYDIYRGYPLADSHDPGFTHPIFRADYSQKKQSADCRFSIPNGIVAVPDVSCVTSFSSTTLETEEDLAKALEVTAEVSGGGYGVSFSASAGYKKATSSMSKENSVIVISTAHCDYYFVKLRKEFAPSFDEEFLVWLSRLDKTDSNETYIDFMDRFGTHFLIAATFGARFTYEHKMTSSYFKSTKDEKFSVAVRASYSGAFSVGGGFSLDQEQRGAASEFSKNVQTRTITVGAAPPANGDALTWASTVQNNPVPTKYTLEPIENLFVNEFVGRLGIDYEAIRLNILRYRKDYEKFREETSPAESIGSSPPDKIDIWYYDKAILTVSNGGIFGDWGEAEFCPKGQFAIGYNLKTQPNQGDGDDTGLNTIKLICADENGFSKGDVITSKQGNWGSYRKEDAMCPNSGVTVYFLTRFQIQMHDWFHIAAAFITFKCQDLQKEKDEIQLEMPPGHGEPWGKIWFSSKSCPVGTAICGIKTKVQDPRGSKGDDTALNDVKFYCCGR